MDGDKHHKGGSSAEFFIALGYSHVIVKRSHYGVVM